MLLSEDEKNALRAMVANEGDTPNLNFLVAGTQFYDYWQPDELRESEVVAPRPAERLQLVRRPDNRKDPNAVEVWFKNGQYQLGHIPRELAQHIAPVLDAGHTLRAYVMLPGSGEAWTCRCMIFGEALPLLVQDSGWDKPGKWSGKNKPRPSREELEERQKAFWRAYNPSRWTRRRRR